MFSITIGHSERLVIWDVDPVPCTPTCLQTRNGKGKQIGGHLCLFDVCISQTSDASLLAITLSMTVSHKHTHTQTYNGHPSLTTLICTHGHPSLHSWSPFSALMVTLLCTHGHPSLHSWSPFSALMVTLFCTHGHPSLHSWSLSGVSREVPLGRRC